MNRNDRVPWTILAVICAVFMAPSDLSAQVAARTKGYEAFVGMRTRNIFDPDRHGPRVESAPTSTPTGNRPDYLALTGTMVTDGKTLAFFSGSRSDFNKVLAIKEKVADYTVTGISSTHVNLERDGKPLTLAVGKQLSMDGSGAISERSEASAPSASTTSSTPGTDMTPPSGVPADKAEILRRMMERRQQENSK